MGLSLESFDHIECETVLYGAWNSGTRTIYKTTYPLWEETVKSGNPLLGDESDPLFTVWPPSLPTRLPRGAVDMDDSDPYFGPHVTFKDRLSAFDYASNDI
jgi:hypothetical protein